MKKKNERAIFRRRVEFPFDSITIEDSSVRSRISPDSSPPILERNSCVA